MCLYCAKYNATLKYHPNPLAFSSFTETQWSLIFEVDRNFIQYFVYQVLHQYFVSQGPVQFLNMICSHVQEGDNVNH